MFHPQCIPTACTTRMMTSPPDVVQSFSKFLDGVSDAFFSTYYKSTPHGFRWAILDFEAHTMDTLDVRFYTYRLFGEDATLQCSIFTK